MPAHREEKKFIDEDALLDALQAPSNDRGPPGPARSPLHQLLSSDASLNDDVPPGLPGRSTLFPEPAAQPLDERARELRVIAKVTDHNLQHLASAAQAREAATRALIEIQTEIDRTSHELTEATEQSRGDLSRDLDQLFDRNLAALARLEKVAADAGVALSWYRTAWRIYAQGKREHDALRAEIEQTRGS